MSEAAHVPFTETKAPESAERLHRGALGLVDISASTMANIGPAYSFYFGFAGIVVMAGVAAPLVARRGHHRHRAARQHAVAVLPGPPEHRRLHHVRGQDVRRHQRGDHGAAVRGRVHHRDRVGAGHLGRVPVDDDPVLPEREHPVDHLLRRLHRRRHVDDVPRRGRVDQAGRLLLRLRTAGAARGGGRHADQARRPPVRVPFEPSQHHQRLQRPGGRLPAGRLPVHRLGELGGAGRGDEQPAAQRAPGRVHVHRADGGHLPAGGLRHVYRLRLQRQGADRRRHPVHQRRPRHRRPGWPSSPTWPG